MLSDKKVKELVSAMSTLDKNRLLMRYSIDYNMAYMEAADCLEYEEGLYLMGSDMDNHIALYDEDGNWMGPVDYDELVKFLVANEYKPETDLDDEDIDLRLQYITFFEG